MKYISFYGILMSILCPIIFEIVHLLTQNNLGMFWSCIVALIIVFVSFAFSIVLLYLFVSKKEDILVFKAIEGNWIEFVDKPSGRAVSVASIKFNRFTLKLTYKGTAYDEYGNIQAEWMCNNLIYEGSRCFVFLGKGKYCFENNREVNTAGRLDFYDNSFNSHKKFMAGKGLYCDYDIVKEDERKSFCADNSFQFERFETVCMKYLNKKDAKDDDLKQVIKAYYKEKSEKMEVEIQ